MGKQIFNRTKTILGISLIILFVMSMGVAVVSADPQDRGHGGGDNYNRNCHWVCDHWNRQSYCDNGHWVNYPYRHWVCDHWSWRWVCSHWSWRCGRY